MDWANTMLDRTRYGGHCQQTGKGRKINLTVSDNRVKVWPHTFGISHRYPKPRVEAGKAQQKEVRAFRNVKVKPEAKMK